MSFFLVMDCLQPLICFILSRETILDKEKGDTVSLKIWNLYDSIIISLWWLSLQCPPLPCRWRCRTQTWWSPWRRATQRSRAARGRSRPCRSTSPRSAPRSPPRTPSYSNMWDQDLEMMNMKPFCLLCLRPCLILGPFCICFVVWWI